MSYKIAAVVVFALLNLGYNALTLKKENARLAADLAEARKKAALLNSKLAGAEAAKTGLREQAQACLKRLNESAMDSENWLRIIEESKARDMSDQEKRKVPDARTRRGLLDSLDKPL